MKIDEKRWTPELELKIIEELKKEGWYKFNLETNKKVFVIDTPPPYPAPVWHIGAVVTYAQQDMIARSRRMMGYEVLYPIGTDRNGIPVEWYVEKYEGIDMWDTPREKFIELCRTALDKYDENILNIMRRIGISGNIDNRYRTDLEDYRALTQATFIELWKKGLIYEDERPNNWCPHCKTTIADAEVEYKERDGILAKIRFPLKEGGEIIIATTRPELLGACKLIIVNPKDDRYKDLVGKKAIVPLYNREVEIKAHRAADPEFGTGALMVCSYGDLEDVRIFREFKLEPIKLIDIDGKLTKEAGKYAGLTVKEAKDKILEDLKKEGYLVEVKDYRHKVPVHDKCKTEIEIVSMPEYYLKQTEFIDDIKKMAEEIKWIPKKHKQRLLDWLNSITLDWPISRRRYYGTEIPLWYCKKCGYIYVPEPGKYYQPWKEDPGISCPKCGAHDWKGEERTLDTWMDSSISVLYITGYKRNEELFEKAFIKGEKLRPQGTDIIRTWLYYTLLRVYQLTGKRAFDYVWINGMGLDEHGRKMSKSLGNIIDPWEIINEFGSDAMRFWSVMESSAGEDFRVSKERIAGAQKFLTKLLNIARFISQYEEIEVKKLTETDKWILSELNKVIDIMLEGYKEFDPHVGVTKLRNFVWEIFASHYLELVKKRLRGEGFEEWEVKSARYTIHQVLKTILLLLAPITPFITYYIWKRLYGDNIHEKQFPSKFEVEDYTEFTEKIIEFNSKIWKEKKEKGLSFKDTIKTEIPKELKLFEKDLKVCHNIV